MHDLIPHSKVFFWFFWVSVVALCAIPSLVLVENAQKYWQFLSAWQPPTMRATTFHEIPHRGAPMDEGSVPDIKFVDFRLKVKKAKHVYLAGDFNHWKPETLPLFRKGRNEWDVMVPLPPGRYEYAFQVDGNWMLDPKAKETGRRGDMYTSVKQVQ